MLLKRERPLTDDFVIKKYLVVKEKYLVEISRSAMLGDTLTKIFRKCLCISCVSEHSEYFKFFPYKNIHFLSGQGFFPINGHVS